MSIEENIQKVAGFDKKYEPIWSCLQAHELWPMWEVVQNHTISTILQRVDTFSYRNLQQCRFLRYSCQWTNFLPLYTTRRDMKAEAIVMCMDCVKTKRESLVKN